MFNLRPKETAKLALMTALGLRLKTLLHAAGFGLKVGGFMEKVFGNENRPYDRAMVQTQRPLTRRSMSEGERSSQDEAIRLRRWLSGDSDSTLELNRVANLTTAGNMVIYDVQGTVSTVIVNSLVFQTTMSIWNFPAEEVPAVAPDPLVTPRNRLLKLCGISGLTKGSAVFAPIEGVAQTVEAFREKVLAGLENKELAPEPAKASTARLS